MVDMSDNNQQPEQPYFLPEKDENMDCFPVSLEFYWDSRERVEYMSIFGYKTPNIALFDERKKIKPIITPNQYRDIIASNNLRYFFKASFDETTDKNEPLTWAETCVSLALNNLFNHPKPSYYYSILLEYAENRRFEKLKRKTGMYYRNKDGELRLVQITPIKPPNVGGSEIDPIPQIRNILTDLAQIEQINNGLTIKGYHTTPNSKTYVNILDMSIPLDIWTLYLQIRLISDSYDIEGLSIKTHPKISKRKPKYITTTHKVKPNLKLLKNSQ